MLAFASVLITRVPRFRLVPLALAALIGGCALDPGVPDPALDLPAAFKATPASAGAAWPRADWWRAFGSAELDRLIAEGRASNLDIAAAIARVQQADAQIRVDTGPLLPELDIETDASRSERRSGSGSDLDFDDADGTGLSGGSSSSDSESYGATLSASYEIDFWGRNLAARRAARADAIATRFDQANVAIGVDASIASTYFAIIVADQRVAIARANLRASEEVLAAIRGRRAAGVATALDEAQQVSQVANVRVTIPPLEQAVEQNANALAILLGRTPERLRIAGEDPTGLAIPPIQAGLPSELLNRRPDIAEAEARLLASRFDVQTAKADLFPSIQLTSSAGFQSDALRSLFDPAGQFLRIAAGLTQPLIGQYALQGQLAQQRALYQEVLQSYYLAVISAFQDVDDALIAVQKTAEREDLQRQAVDAAARAYAISRARLDEGIIDLQTLLDTEQTLFEARDALAQARLERLQAIVDLYQALGGGWQEPRPPEAAPIGATRPTPVGAEVRP